MKILCVGLAALSAEQTTVRLSSGKPAGTHPSRLAFLRAGAAGRGQAAPAGDRGGCGRPGAAGARGSGPGLSFPFLLNGSGGGVEKTLARKKFFLRFAQELGRIFLSAAGMVGCPQRPTVWRWRKPAICSRRGKTHEESVQARPTPNKFYSGAGALNQKSRIKSAGAW